MAKTLYSEPTGFSKGATPNGSPLAPAPSFPERVPTFYERKNAPDVSGQQGPARFYEGLASDKDIPNQFSFGVMQGYETADGRSNHNKNVYEKDSAETEAERAHVGSASWTDAPSHLADFAHGTDTVLAERHYEQVDRGQGLGQRYQRRSAAEIWD
jgi:hypothetical protein